MRKTVLFGLLIIVLAFGFIGCDHGNGTFASSTNDSILNDIATLGLIGTTVSSSNENVVTVEIAAGRIKITSAGQGLAIITVAEGEKNATINVTVSNTGSITIGTIVKYEDTGNGNFVSSTNDSISNDVSTLGLIGTSVSSNNENVATAIIELGKIKITSVGTGTAIITISDASGNNAAISVTISADGSITIDNVNKFTPEPETNIGTDSAIGDRLFVSNFPVFDFVNNQIVPFEFNGTLELNPWFLSGAFYDELFPKQPDITATIANNKISFDVGELPSATLMPLADSFSSSAAGVQGIIFASLDFWDYINDESYSFRLINKNNIDESIAFVYVSSDIDLNGIDWRYWELSLKEGWNTVKIDDNRMTVITFVPNDDFIWLNRDSGWGADVGGQPLRIHYDDITKISGTVNVSVDGAFPVGGISLTALKLNSDESFGTLRIENGTNPIPWEFSPSYEYFEYGIMLEFILTVFPTNDESNFFEYRIGILRDEGQRVMDVYFVIEDIPLQGIFINTQNVSVSVNGFGTGKGAIWANSSFVFRGDYLRHGMQITGDGIYTFKLPVGFDNWLWFKTIVDSNEYFSKGRLNVNEQIILNRSDMYPAN